MRSCSVPILTIGRSSPGPSTVRLVRGQTATWCFDCRLPDGSIRRVHVVAHAGVDGSGALQFVGAIMDVTEQWQAREELERAFGEKTKSEAELRTVIDVIPQLIVTIGADGQLQHANQALLEYTGLSEEDLQVGARR